MSTQQQREATTTMVRNLYDAPSESASINLNIKLFDMMLALQLRPLRSRKEDGTNDWMPIFIQQPGQKGYPNPETPMAVIDYPKAYTLYEAVQMIIRDKDICLSAGIQIKDGTLSLDRNVSPDGTRRTTLTISKNGKVTVFPFRTSEVQVMVPGGQFEKRVIESSLGEFGEVLRGYLNGINTDRHQNKLTDKYVESLGASAKPPNQSSFQQQSVNRYQGGGGYNNRGNQQYGGNRGNFRGNNNYNRGGGYNRSNNYNSGNQQPQQGYQNMNNFTVPN